MPADRERRTREPSSRRLGRRQFLQSVTGGALLASGSVAGASGPDIRLAGGIDRWSGRAPDSIEGVTNPALSLEPGATYAIEWTNVDGKPHNVVIEGESGDRYVRSDVVEEEDVTQTVEFTAEEAMTSYYCEVHPSAMRGEIRVGSGVSPTRTRGTKTPFPDQSAIPQGPSVRLEPIASGLTSPLAFETAPDEDDLTVVVDQLGTVRVLEDGGLREEPFLDIRDRTVDVGEGSWADYDERGLLGLAFHPEFRDNRRFYVRYSAPPRQDGFVDYGHTAVIAEFEATADARRARPDSERIVLEVDMPGPVHNGGAITFGPDGNLYAGLGDGSTINDVGEGHAEDWYDGNPGGNGQDVTENLLGSVIRVDVDTPDGGDPYAIPDDNPLVGNDGLNEHYAWGLRNPWRMSFDSDGRLFLGDPGGRRYEEVNVVEKGGNYGWNVREASDCFDANNMDEPPDECPDRTPEDVRGGEPLLDPIAEYPHWDEHGRPVGIAVIGGYFYESDRISALEDTYVFGDFSKAYDRPAGSLFSASPPDDGDETWSIRKLTVENSENGQLGRYLFGFGRDDDGSLYTLTNETGAPSGSSGAVHRIVSPESAADDLTQIGSTTGGRGDSRTPGENREDAGSILPRGANQLSFVSLTLFGGAAGLVAYLISRARSRRP